MKLYSILAAAACRTALCALAALALAVALPHAGFAAGREAGLWKINPSLSTSNSRGSRLVIERAKAMDGTSSTFVVINGGSVYLVTPAADASLGVKSANYGAWKGMKLTQIGKGAKVVNDCDYLCRFGDVSDRLKLSFRNVGAGQQMSSVLAGNQ